MSTLERRAISYINKNGALLVFPIKTNLAVPSLWQCFYPKSRMNWDWSEEGDSRVAEIWHLRELLSRSGKVVYVKWFQGRATLFSIQVFTALLSCFASHPDPLKGLDEPAKRVYRALSDDSPLPTKVLRQETDLAGKEKEAEFQCSIKALWRRLLIVGYGEVDEGGFPSLAVGCSKHLFEPQWDEAQMMDQTARKKVIGSVWEESSAFGKAYQKLEQMVAKLKDDASGRGGLS